MKFTENFTLKRHQISKHSNEKTKMLQCDKCNKYYMSKDALQRHKRIIHGNVIFKCEICNKEFNTKTRFSTHMEFIHTVQKQEFQCNVCEKSYKALLYLKKHLLTHKVKEFKCEECGKKLSSKHYLNKHKSNFHTTLETENLFK